jgi:hypothetical protein
MEKNMTLFVLLLTIEDFTIQDMGYGGYGLMVISPCFETLMLA